MSLGLLKQDQNELLHLAWAERCSHDYADAGIEGG